MRDATVRTRDCAAQADPVRMARCGGVGGFGGGGGPCPLARGRRRPRWISDRALTANTTAALRRGRGICFGRGRDHAGRLSRPAKQARSENAPISNRCAVGVSRRVHRAQHRVGARTAWSDPRLRRQHDPARGRGSDRRRVAHARARMGLWIASSRSTSFRGLRAPSAPSSGASPPRPFFWPSSAAS